MLDIAAPRRRPAASAAPRSWSRPARRMLLLTHILSSVGWWGAAVMIAVFVAMAALAADGVVAGALIRSVGVAVWVTVAGAAVAAATGILLGWGTRWGVVRYRWVVAKEAITAVMVVTDLTVVRATAAQVLAHIAAPTDLVGPTLGHVVFLTVATVLSVYKPWGRVTGGRRVGLSS